MSEAKYRLKTDEGLSGEYTLEHLKHKTSQGDVDDAAQCTADNGDTWISLRTLSMENRGRGAEPSAEPSAEPASGRNNEGSKTAASAKSSPDAQAATGQEESSQSLHSGTRKLRRLTVTSTGTLAAARSARSARTAPSSGGIKQPEDLIGVSLADDRYRIVSKLGNGSMAYVLRAIDNRLNTEVVVKVPKPEKMTDKDIRDRFRRESQLMVELTHPHVVKVQDVGEYMELPYVIMQLLSGGTLADRICSGADGSPRLPAESLKTWLREVARALDFCCRKGTVHRDIKPANILFDTDGNAYVSDFGLTKIMYGEHTSMDPSDTAAGVVLGTPNYIAPEIILGHKYDGRADQYSLGITAYHTLLGRPPMQGDSATATMINQTQKHLQLLSDIRSDVPRDVALAIRRSIDKDPQKRFASCEEFANAVIDGFRSSASSASGTAPVITEPVQVPEAVRSSGQSSQSSARRRPPNTRKTSPNTTAGRPGNQQEPNLFGSGPLPARKSKGRASRETKTVKKNETLILGHPVRPGLVIAAAAAVAVLTLSVIVSKLTGTGDESPAFVMNNATNVSSSPDAVSSGLAATTVNTANTTDTAKSTKTVSQNSDQKNGKGKKNKQSGNSKTNDAVASADSMPHTSHSSTATSSGPEVATTGPATANKSATPVSSTASATNGSPKPATPASQANLARDVSDVLPLKSGNRLTMGPPACPVLISDNVVWNLTERKTNIKLEGTYPEEALTSLSADGKYFVAASKPPNQENTDLLIWDTATGKRVGTVSGETGKFADMVITSPRQLFVGGRFADELAVFDCETASRRKPIRIPGARFKPGSAAVSHDGQYLAVAAESGMAVLKISTGKPVVVMQNPPEKPRSIGSRPPSSTNNNRTNAAAAATVLASLRSLHFSPDNQEIAGIASHPEPRLLCWNSRGELVTDQALPLDEEELSSSELEWHANGNSWLIVGRIFDRESGRLLFSQQQLSTLRQIHFYDQERLLGSFAETGEMLSTLPIPWKSIRLSLASMNDGAASDLAPQGSVSIDIEVAEKQPAIQTAIRKALTKRLQADDIKVEPDKAVRIRVRGSDAPETLVLELLVSGSEQPLWRQQINDIRALSAAWQSADEKTRQQEIDALSSEIASVSTPWFVPKDRSLAILPVISR